jgi:cation:H+ antiporter
VTALLFIIGLVFLVVGAELLVRGAGKLAIRFGVAPLVVGLTVVAFGTSSPEMAVSVGSARDGNVDIAVGNVVGSNIFNVLFILGACALIAPLLINRQIIRKEVPIMIATSLLLIALGADGKIQRYDGVILFALVIVYTVLLIRQSRKETKSGEADLEAEGISLTSTWDQKLPVQIGLIVAGLVLLVVGADWLVDSAIEFAESLGVSQLVIGLTIVAAGTSMPEVATSILATIRGERDIAVGNVIGSNIFNILTVVGLSAIVAPDPLIVNEAVRNFDFWVMLAVAVACLPIFFTGSTIARWEGIVFLLYYVAYTAYLILDSQDHDALDTFSNVMLLFVVPITVITIGIVAVREWKARSATPAV